MRKFIYPFASMLMVVVLSACSNSQD